MATSKVAFFSPPGDRADYMVEQAPEDIEIVLVDPSLSDDEKASGFFVWEFSRQHSAGNNKKPSPGSGGPGKG